MTQPTKHPLPSPNVPFASPLALNDAEFETVLADLSTTFVNVPAAEVNDRILGAAQTLLDVLGFDRTAVFCLDETTSDFRVIAAWARPGIQPHAGDITRTDLPWFMERLSSGGAFYMPTIEDLPAHAIDERRYALDSNLKSVLTIGFSVSGTISGAVSFASVRNHRDLSDAVVRRVRLVGEIFGNALARARADLEQARLLNEIRALKDRLQAENTVLREEVTRSHDFDEIIGESAALNRVLKLVDQVCATDATVLITGETGTGKELVARAIHRRSPRGEKPFVAVNCSALPASLIESELFGHEKGAFTGASARKIGRFELADGGTIFLDEVGELTPELQPKLLRVLQDGEIMRLGSTRTVKVDVRLITATNRSLPDAVENGRFRDDLYYRLAVFPITLPPLRERPEDIPLLVWHCINRKQSRLGKRIESIPQSAMEAMCAYAWPGNVRELENVVERAMILSAGSALHFDDAIVPAARRSPSLAGHNLLEVERDHIARVLRACNGKINGKGNAADRLGLKPSTLRFRMKKLGLSRSLE